MVGYFPFVALERGQWPTVPPRGRFEPIAEFMIELVRPHPIELAFKRRPIVRLVAPLVGDENPDEHLGLLPPMFGTTRCWQIPGKSRVTQRRASKRDAAMATVKAKRQAMIDEAST
jgi:hypothetical protein